MRRILYPFTLLFFAATLGLVVAQHEKEMRQISLPTGKSLTIPSPGVLGSLNGFAAAMTVSPDRRYAAILNDGYGTQRNQAHQSIAMLDLSTNNLTDFPEDRLPESAHQSYFMGLAFSSDGNHLYASIGSITDPVGEKAGDTGNGIAVYSFHNGKVVWDRFIRMSPQKIAAGKKVAIGVRKTAEGTAISYPAGLAVIAGRGGPDRLLVANNLSDNVVLIDSASGRVLEQFDLSTRDMVPSSFPYTVVASRDGRRAWCSLWNASRVAELDLEKGTVARWISLLEPKEPTSRRLPSHRDAAEPGRKAALCGIVQCRQCGSDRNRIRLAQVDFGDFAQRAEKSRNLSRRTRTLGRRQTTVRRLRVDQCGCRFRHLTLKRWRRCTRSVEHDTRVRLHPHRLVSQRPGDGR